MNPMKAVDTGWDGLSDAEFAQRLVTQARRHVAYLSGWFDQHADADGASRARRELSYLEPLLLLIGDKVDMIVRSDAAVERVRV